MGKYSSFDKKRTREYFESFVKAVRPNSVYPRINLLYGDMSRDEIASLFKSKEISCYVSLTRAEGYGLPIVDAAASGLPIIATNYSGHLQFLKGQKFLPVDYNLVEVPKERIDNRIFVPNTRWADPIKKSFFTSLDDLYNNYELHRQNALVTKQHITQNFSKNSIVEKYNEKFGSLL
jgi:glycosyltransferase involved in cell wall biosynthesis